MKTKQKTKMNYLAIILSLIIGFVGGIVFSAYKIPDIASQIPVNQQQEGSTDEEIARHIKHLKETALAKENDPEAWTKLAHAYFEANALSEAIEAYLKVLEFTPDDSAIYTDLGVMYRRSNQPEKALEAFEKAIEIDPNNIHSQFNIGIVLFHDLEDKQGAVEAWKKVAEKKPDYQISTGQTIVQLLQNVE
jgi:cytochrome c-type biogenesis protein CcmH/NrfG